MPKVLPRDILHVLEREWPTIIEPVKRVPIDEVLDGRSPSTLTDASILKATQMAAHLDPNSYAAYSSLKTLLSQFDPGYLASEDDYSKLMQAQGVIGDILTTYSNTQTLPMRLTAYNTTIVILLWDIMRRCRTPLIGTASRDLSFIADADERKRVESEIQEVQKSLEAGNWKAVTVMAASLMEFLLFHALTKLSNAELKTLATASKTRIQADLTDRGWTLGPIINVVTLCNKPGSVPPSRLFTDNTIKLCSLAMEGRNLVHPGAEYRRKAICNRKTAYTACAALEAVLEDWIR